MDGRGRAKQEPEPSATQDTVAEDVRLRHCEERSDEAISIRLLPLPGIAAPLTRLAMTGR